MTLGKKFYSPDFLARFFRIRLRYTGVTKRYEAISRNETMSKKLFKFRIEKMLYGMTNPQPKC